MAMHGGWGGGFHTDMLTLKSVCQASIELVLYIYLVMGYIYLISTSKLIEFAVYGAGPVLPSAGLAFWG